MATDGSNILLFAILSVIFLVAVIAALPWGYGRLSARNRHQ